MIFILTSIQEDIELFFGVYTELFTVSNFILFRCFSLNILIESKWNLNHDIPLNKLNTVIHINRIKVEFKLITVLSIKHTKQILIESKWNLNQKLQVFFFFSREYINRITVEFKFLILIYDYQFLFILIESQWNLNSIM